MSNRWLSMLLLLVTMVIWGSTFVVTKQVIGELKPFTLTFVRVAIGTLVMLPAAISRCRHEGPRLPWLTVGAMGLIGVVLHYVAFNYSMLYISASQGALVQSCIPAMTALVAVLWLREPASWARWLGIALSMIGVAIVFAGGPLGDSRLAVLGNALMFFSAACWGVYTSMAKRVAGFDAVVVTASVTGAGTLLLLPLAAFEVSQSGLPRLHAAEWIGVLYLGAVASGVAYLLYNAALRYLDASQVGVYTNLIPVVGVLTGTLVLSEPLSAQAVVGGVVVIAGVYVTSWHARDRRVGSSISARPLPGTEAN